MKVQLEEIYNKMKNNDLKMTTEEYLFMFNVDFLHVISLMWSKSRRKSTHSYQSYLISECVKNFIAAAINSKLDIGLVEHDLNQLIVSLDNEVKSSDIDSYITGFNAEEELGRSDSFFRLAFLCFLHKTLIGDDWDIIVNSQKFD